MIDVNVPIQDLSIFIQKEAALMQQEHPMFVLNFIVSMLFLYL
jgi:hypothetical protein